jgi:hypothetical protein
MPVTVKNTGLPKVPAGSSDLVMQIIEEVKKNPMTARELALENARLMAYGARQANKAGIKERGVPCVIHESRSRQRSS